MALRHGAATIGLAGMSDDQQAGGRRHRGPEDHNRQHQQRAFSAPMHDEQVSSLTQVLTVSIRRRASCGGDLDHNRENRCSQLLVMNVSNSLNSVSCKRTKAPICESRAILAPEGRELGQ
jgi:hypothetical protein